MNKLVQIIALSKRAGKLVFGFDSVSESLKDGKAFVMIASNKLSEKTLKEVKFLSEKYGVRLIMIDETLDELWYLIGKRTGIFSIADENLSKKIIACSTNEADK